MLRIKLRYEDVETLVARFASNVGKSGLFLPTKAIQPIGTEVKFELRLASDAAVLVGLGKVKHVKPHDPARPKATFGMAIELTRVSREGRDLIIKMLERRRSLGLPEVAIPVPEDVEVARRAMDDSQPRAETSGIVREAMRDFASAPVAEQVLAPRASASGPIGTEVVRAPNATPAADSGVSGGETDIGTPAADTGTSAGRTDIGTPARDAAMSAGGTGIGTGTSSGPGELAVRMPTEGMSSDASAHAASAASGTGAGEAPTSSTASASSDEDARSGADATSSRTSDADGAEPVVIAPVESRPVPALAPERERRTRRRPDDLLAAANELAGRLEGVAIPDLEAPVDLERAFARARALAGSDLDGDLADLRESAAAPIEVSLEAASAELARQLGGKPLARRERSAKWNAPLSTPVLSPVPAPASPSSGTELAASMQFEASVTVVPEASPVPEPIVSVRAESSAPIAALASADGDDDPAREYATDDKTRVPAGDIDVLLPPMALAEDPADDLEIPHEGGFANVSEEQLRTVPGDVVDADENRRADESRRAYESSPALALDESDLEQVDDDELALGENTHVGATPDGLRALANTGIAAPVIDEAAARLDRELEQAESEADEELREMQSADGGSPYVISPYTGGTPYLDSEPVPLVDPVRPSVPISDLDVLSEADAREADLLGASAEPMLGESNPTFGDAPAYDEAAHAAAYSEGGDAAAAAYSGGDDAAAAAYSDGGDAGYRAEPAYADAVDSGHGAEPPYENALDPGHGIEPPYENALDPGYGAEAAYGGAFDSATADDFADRLALDDDELDREEARNFPTANPRPHARTANHDNSLEAALQAALDRPSSQSMDIALDDLDDAAAGPPVRPDIPNTAFLDAPSDSYTFAEPFPNTGVQFAPHQGGEDFDEPHGFTVNTPAPPSPRSKSEPEFERRVRSTEDDPVARALQSFDEPSQSGAAASRGDGLDDVLGAAPSRGDELDDALAGLDVPSERPSRPSRPSRTARSAAKSRPLPGLPPETPPGGTPTTPANPPADAKAAAPRSRVGANVIQRAPKSVTASPPKGAAAPSPKSGPSPKGATAPPPIPAAARKAPTTPPPTPVKVPPKAAAKPASRRSSPRMPSDDGILIDFDDDE